MRTVVHSFAGGRASQTARSHRHRLRSTTRSGACFQPADTRALPRVHSVAVPSSRSSPAMNSWRLRCACGISCCWFRVRARFTSSIRIHPLQCLDHSSAPDFFASGLVAIIALGRSQPHGEGASASDGTLDTWIRTQGPPHERRRRRQPRLPQAKCDRLSVRRLMAAADGGDIFAEAVAVGSAGGAVPARVLHRPRRARP